MALNFQERLARQKTFDPKNISVGGPINIILSCSVYNNDNYRKGHEHTFGKQDMFKNLNKETI